MRGRGYAPPLRRGGGGGGGGEEGEEEEGGPLGGRSRGGGKGVRGRGLCTRLRHFKDGLSFGFGSPWEAARWKGSLGGGFFRSYEACVPGGAGMLRGALALVAVVGTEAVPAGRSDAGVLRGTEEVAKQIAQGRRQLRAEVAQQIADHAAGRQLQDVVTPPPPPPSGLRPMGTRAAKIGCYENFGWADTIDAEQVAPPDSPFFFGSTDGCGSRHTLTTAPVCVQPEPMCLSTACLTAG